MGTEETNNQEEIRLKDLIKSTNDKFHKKCLGDDLNSLKVGPKEYWMLFRPESFQPGNIIETQRLNTIIAMQKHYGI